MFEVSKASNEFYKCSFVSKILDLVGKLFLEGIDMRDIDKLTYSLSAHVIIHTDAA